MKTKTLVLSGNAAFAEEDEALVDTALQGRPFRFLALSVAPSEVLPKEVENYR